MVGRDTEARSHEGGKEPLFFWCRRKLETRFAVIYVGVINICVFLDEYDILGIGVCVSESSFSQLQAYHTYYTPCAVFSLISSSR